MGLSLEGFGEEFEIGKIAFDLEDLKRTHWRKKREAQEKIIERRTCRYVSRFLLYHHLVSIFPDFLVF